MQKRWNAIDPMLRKNRSLERSSKKQRPDKHSQNRPKRTEKQPRKTGEKPQKHSQKRRKPTSQNTAANQTRKPLSRVQSVGSCDQPSGAPHYVIPVALQIQTRLESPKNKAQKTAEQKQRNPKRKATKNGQSRQQTAPKENKQKATQTRNQDRIASLKTRKNTVLQAPIQTTCSRN